MSNKLSEKEHFTLQEMRRESLDIITSLGELNYQKQVIDIQLEEQKENIIKLRKKESQFFEELKNTYGNVMVNIETGELTPSIQQ